MELVSIIIPTYNNEKYIISAIQSVLNQNYLNIECIVVNDGSTDETAFVIANSIAERKISYYYQENKGVSAARNLGIEKSTGDYLLFLDADDILAPNAINDLLSCLLQENVEMCVGLAENELGLEKKFIYSNQLANLISNWWPISTVILKKNNLYWNENMKVWEVIDYFSKLLLGSFKCSICPKIVTSINHNPRRDRVTFLYDHYNSYKTFDFFSKLKNDIVLANKMDSEIAESIDKHLLSNAYTIYKESKYFPALENIDSANLKNYSWFKPFGISGFCSFLGFKRGMAAFYTLNRLLRRV